MNSSYNNTFTMNCGFETKLYYIILIFLTVMTVLLQSISIILFLKYRMLREVSSNYILFSLSLTDMVTGLTPILVLLIECNHCNMALLRILLPIMYTLANICLFSSIAHLLAYSTERLISIFMALQYPLIVTTKKVMTAITILYIISILLPVTEIAMWSSGIRTDFINIAFAILAFCAIIISIVEHMLLLRKILNVSKKYQGQSRRVYSRKLRGIILSTVMLISFLILATPHYILKFLLVYKVYHPDLIDGVLKLFILLRYSVSVINPLIYTFIKKDYRKSLLRMINIPLKQHQDDKRKTNVHLDLKAGLLPADSNAISHA